MQTEKREKDTKEVKITKAAKRTKDAKSTKAAKNMEVVKKNTIIRNSKVWDSSSKIIFGDSMLCAQFINDYVDVLKGINVQPEDIEDVSERYVTLIAEERGSDTVKKVKVANEKPFYFISLIEHKTRVDYNVGMQIFRYMYLIWEDYEKEMEAQHKGISKTIGFRYPMVVPIVYYEGAAEWSASRQFREKISMQEMFGDMVPNFTYQLVSVNDYSNAELLEKGDAISLTMLLGKIRERTDLEEFLKLSSEQLDEIVGSLPEHLRKKIGEIFRVWLYSMNLPEEEVEMVVSRVEEKSMSRLFEGMKIDIQADRETRRTELQQISEGQQQLAKDQQQLTEGQRQLSEDQQQLAEDQQQLVEDQRQLAEDQQQLAEGQRQLAEGQRQLSEDQQQLSEGQQRMSQEQQQFSEMKEALLSNYIDMAVKANKVEELIVEELQYFFGVSEEVAVEKLREYCKEQENK